MYDEINNLFVNNSPLPAKLFDCISFREFFQPLFLYAVFGGIASQIETSSEGLIVSIESEKKELSENIELSKEYSTEQLSSLFTFYSKFIERGTREIYRTLWHRAIVEHCSSPIEIIECGDEIAHYYQSLEQNAIEGNFTELSGAVQDAQVFIGDVTNTLSDSTVNATNEIQKVVIALFTVIAGNLFFVIREGERIEAATFTVVFSAGVLLLYFPTAQERISELSDIIEEGESDADLYSDLVRNVGADELVDLDRFEDRQQSYIGLADQRVEWAEKRLEQAFELFIGVWSLTSAYVFFTAPLFSNYSLLVGSTTIASVWIGTKQTSREYQPKTKIGTRQIGAGFIPIIVMLLMLGVLTVV